MSEQHGDKQHPVVRMLRKFTASPDVQGQEDLRRAAELAGVRLVSACEDRQWVELLGHLSSVTVGPRGEGSAMEAEFTDGSGTVRLVWMGRRTIAGIDAGRAVRVEGRLSFVDGLRTIYNPKYELRA